MLAPDAETWPRRFPAARTRWSGPPGVAANTAVALALGCVRGTVWLGVGPGGAHRDQGAQGWRMPWGGRRL